LDLVVILNFLVDGLLLLGTNRLSGHPPGWGRVLPAAAMGGMYAGMCMVPGFGFLGNVLWRLLCLGAMSGVAFGWNAGAVKRGAVFLLLSMAMGGLALGLGSGNFGSLLLAAVSLAVLCVVGLPHPVGSRSYLPVRLRWNGKVLDFTALMDTGNTLRDPITGSPVLVAGADVGERLGFSREILSDPVKALAGGSGSGRVQR
jgi:stage II sporulation protein GA (sporulation sigma-E factor processing peptidase)